MDAIQRGRSLILVAIMMLAAFVPAISPYDIENPILEDEEPIMETGTGPEMITNLNQAMSIGSSNIDRVHDMASGPSGSVYFIGEFQGTISFGGYTLTSNGSYFDVFVAKLKNNGQWGWIAKISGSSTDRGYGIAVDSSGNAYVTGSCYNTCYFSEGGQTQGNITSQGSADLYVAMIKNSGQWDWIASAGSSGGSECGLDIAVDASGNSYVTGYVRNGTVFKHPDGSIFETISTNGGKDILAAKLDLDGNWKWVKTAGGLDDDTGASIDIDSSGDAYITGYFTNDSIFGDDELLQFSSEEMFVAKVSESATSGEASWSWAVPFTGWGTTKGTSIAVGPNGGVFATGIFTSNITVGATNHGVTSGTIATVVSKLNQSNGQILWYNSALGSDVQAKDLLISDTEIIITGNHKSSSYFGNYDIFGSSSANDGFIAALNPSNGTWNWSERIESGGGDVQMNNIEMSPDGSLAVAGYFSGTINLLGTNFSAPNNNHDIFLANIIYAKEGCYVDGANYNNASQWSICSGGSSSVVIEDVTTDSAGNFYMTGYFTGTAIIWGEILVSSGGSDIFIAMLNNNEAWAVKAGGSSGDYGNGIAVDSSGNAYATGNFQGTASFGSTSLSSSSNSQDIFIAKLSSSGSWQWAVKAGGPYPDGGKGIAVDSSGNAYATGYFQGTATFGSTSLTSSGNDDIFIAKLSSSGSWQWAVKAGGSSGDSGYGIAVDSSGNAYATGYFDGTATFGSTSLTRSGGSGTDIFVAKLSSSGSWQWAVKAGGSSGSDGGYGIAVDSSGNAYATGFFRGTATFGSTSLTSSGDSDIFIAKLSSSGSWQWVVKAGGSSSDGGAGIAVDSSGNAYVAGTFGGTATFGSTSLTSSGSDDIFIAKLSSSGSWQWVVKAGGSSEDYGNGIAVDSSGNAYVTGDFTGTATFGPQSLSCVENEYCGFLWKVDTPAPPPSTAEGNVYTELSWNSSSSELVGFFYADELVTGFNYTVVYYLNYTSNNTVISDGNLNWFANDEFYPGFWYWNMQTYGFDYAEEYNLSVSLHNQSGTGEVLAMSEDEETIPEESNYSGDEWYMVESGITIDETNDSWSAWINVSSMPVNTNFNITYNVELAYDSVSLAIFNETLEYENWDGTETNHIISRKTLSENVMSIAGRYNEYCLSYDMYHSSTGVAASGGSTCNGYNPPISNDGDWIPDSYEGAFTQTSSSLLDTDGDGWGDWIEHWGGSDPDSASSTPTDADNDGLPYLLEEMMGTSDNENDSDGDGALDFDDFRYGGHPARASYLPPNGDWDSCWDYWEDQVGLNSSNPDSDGDGVYDCFESDPWNASSTPTDTDGDGLPDDLELLYNTNLSNPDSDGDGVPDSAEIGSGTDPNDGLNYNVNYWSNFYQTLEQFGTVTASTTATIYSANNVLDDDHSSYWQPENPCPGWIEIDLGNVYRPSYIEVSIFNEDYDDDYPREFIIETRENPSDNWRNISSFTFDDNWGISGAFGGYTELHKVRYVRIYCISSNDDLEVPHDIAFSEITIYDSTNLQYVNLSAIDNQTTGGTNFEMVGGSLNVDSENQTTNGSYTVSGLQNGVQYSLEWRFTNASSSDCTIGWISILFDGNIPLTGSPEVNGAGPVEIDIDSFAVIDWSGFFCLELELYSSGDDALIATSQSWLYIDTVPDGENNNTNNNTNTDADSDGVNDLFDLCPNTPADADVDSDGCEIAETHEPMLDVMFDERQENGVWSQDITVSISDIWLNQNYSMSLKVVDSNGNTIYSYFSPMDEDDQNGWWRFGNEMVEDPTEQNIDLNWDGLLTSGEWEGSSRFFDETEYPFFGDGEYCVEISLGHQINSNDAPMDVIKNIFDNEEICGEFLHESMDGVVWDGSEEEGPQSTLDKLMSNKIVSSLLDFMDSTTGQIVSIGLAILGFAGKMVLARGQRAKNKRVTKFSKAIRKADTRGRIKILEMDIEKANEKKRLPRGGYGDLMEQIESRLESLGFDDDPDQGSTSGNWTSGDEMQQASEMMWDAQDMMEDAREDAKMTRQAVEDLQDRLNIDTKYAEEPVSKGPRYERTGVRLSDSAASTGPSLPGSKEGGLEAKPDLVASILSQNIAPKDDCPCGNGKMYKDCHMKRGRKKKSKW